MFDENPIDDAEDVRGDPALWPAMSRKASMGDPDVAVGNDHAGLIFPRRRNALAKIKQTVTAWLDMSAVLDESGDQ
jgi:hypothetical protein